MKLCTDLPLLVRGSWNLRSVHPSKGKRLPHRPGTFFGFFHQNVCSRIHSLPPHGPIDPFPPLFPTPKLGIPDIRGLPKLIGAMGKRTIEPTAVVRLTNAHLPCRECQKRAARCHDPFQAPPGLKTEPKRLHRRNMGGPKAQKEMTQGNDDDGDDDDDPGDDDDGYDSMMITMMVMTTFRFSFDDRCALCICQLPPSFSTSTMTFDDRCAIENQNARSPQSAHGA